MIDLTLAFGCYLYAMAMYWAHWRSGPPFVYCLFMQSNLAATALMAEPVFAAVLVWMKRMPYEQAFAAVQVWIKRQPYEPAYPEAIDTCVVLMVVLLLGIHFLLLVSQRALVPLLNWFSEWKGWLKQADRYRW